MPLSRQTLVALHHRSHGLEQMLSPAQGRYCNGPDQGQGQGWIQPLNKTQVICTLLSLWPENGMAHAKFSLNHCADPFASGKVSFTQWGSVTKYSIVFLPMFIGAVRRLHLRHTESTSALVAKSLWLGT